VGVRPVLCCTHSKGVILVLSGDVYAMVEEYILYTIAV